MKNITIGLIGNPNAGKTTLFNQLTGAKQRVGNWAGVTVERKEGYFETAEALVKLVDLPGTYSLTTISKQTSIDEQIACHFMLSGEAEMLINVLDAANLERNLYLTLQLIELGIPCIVVLNMLDLAQSQHIKIDPKILAKNLGCPVIPMVSTRATGIEQLKTCIDNYSSQPFKHLVNYPSILITAAHRLQAAMNNSLSKTQQEWLAFQILEGDIYAYTKAGNIQNTLQEINQELMEQHHDPALLIASARYQTISHLCSIACNIEEAIPNHLTVILDKIVLNRLLGVPIFFFVMYIMFFMAINLGGALQPIFDIGSSAIFISGIQWIGFYAHLPNWLTVFLAQGIGGGINTILPLIPQIGLMFLFLSFLEDSGYMARAAFVMDKLMQTLGLPGKSFVPLIVGFGCNVPSIMGARTLDTPRERIITIMMSPFMSCGARLAIFAVFAGSFFGGRGALVIFSLYLLGIAVAIFTGLLFKHTMLKGEATPFIMELPIYHVPHFKSLMLQTWQRLKSFILRAGKVIVMASILIGGLNSFSLTGHPVNNINDSILASISKKITPVLYPLGITANNWQAMVGLVTGAMAKEVVVGTLNTLYTAENITQTKFDPTQFNLFKEFKSAIDETEQNIVGLFNIKVLTNPIEASKGDGNMSSGAMGVMHTKFNNNLSAYAYLIFVLLYIPCASVMGAIARETSKSWMFFSIIWGIDMAYSISVLFYQIATFTHHRLSSSLTILIVLIINSIIISLLKIAEKHVTKSLSFSAQPIENSCKNSADGCHS